MFRKISGNRPEKSSFVPNVINVQQGNFPENGDDKKSHQSTSRKLCVFANMVNNIYTFVSGYTDNYERIDA